VTPPSDFRVLENFRRKMHCWKLQTKPDVKQLCGFHYQRNVALNLPELSPLDHYVWENIRGQSHVSSKTEDIAVLKEMLQMIV